MPTAELELSISYRQENDGWWVAQVPDVPGAVSQGRSKSEAKEAALVALALVLQLRPEGLLSGTTKIAA